MRYQVIYSLAPIARNNQTKMPLSCVVESWALSKKTWVEVGTIKRRFSYFEVALTLPALLSFRTVSPRHCACAMTARSWLVLRGRALSNLAACMLQMPRSEIAVGWPSEAPQRDLAASCTEAELRCAM